MTETVEQSAGLGTLALLERSGQITATSLRLVDVKMPFEQWAALGAYLGEIKSRASWYIGDWLNFGEETFGDRYSQAMEATGLSYATLTNYASVCRRVAFTRRRDDLSFGHHDEVSALTPAEQRHWLAEAHRQGWTRSDLREARRALAPPVQQVVERNVTPRQAVDAARGLTEVRETLRRAERGEDVTAALGAALLAVDEVGGTLQAALDAAPSTRQVARRLLEEAVPDGDDHYRVTRGTLDELRVLVTDEGGDA